MKKQRRLLTYGAVGILAPLGCVSPGEGPSPSGSEMYFPSGMAVSPGGHTLYVANSDFDLRFNGGTVMALDLDRIRDAIPPVHDATLPGYPCGKLARNAQRALFPGPCAPIPLASPPDGAGSLVAASVQIGAFASDLLVVAQPDGPNVRLFAPVRGDPSVTWMEVDDDRTAERPSRKLFCGGERCDAAHRAGEEPENNLRRVVLPPEPYGIAATQAGDALVVTHQSSDAMSLISNPWDGLPTLQFVSSGFPQGGVGIAPVPVPAYVSHAGFDYQPGFLVTFRAAAEVDLVRYYDDGAASPSRPFVTRAAASPLWVNASGVDSRGIAVDSSARTSCESQCSPTDGPCLQTCASIPLSVYIANRTPPSLLIGETRTAVSSTRSDDSVTVYDSVPLTYGASRVLVGDVIEPDGTPSTRVFVSCFDARSIFIYSPKSRRIEGVVHTGRGPHAMVVDPKAPYLYVAHFTDSYIGVIDLDQGHADTYATLIASIGVPTPPRDSK